MPTILGLGGFLIQWIWERKMQVVSKESTLALDKGEQEKVKQRQFWKRCVDHKEEMFVAFALAVDNYPKSSCARKIWWYLIFSYSL